MPLPINTTLSLLGASRPGDALPSKPKKAMLVRLSSEILDALEATAQPMVQFEFGENPGLYIGDTSFPMVHSQETAIHELYLRAASATKKNAPLKLYANVVGKFAVEQREIGNGLRDKIRESTQDAAAQKSSRATVFMGTPPETQPVNKKRKDASMFHKPPRQSDKVKPALPASATSTPVSKATPTHQPSTSHQGGIPVRKRLVHCLARGEKSEEEIFKLLGGDRNASLRAEIAGLLDQLTDLKTEKSGKVYRLKPIGWKEVRPFEWPGLSEQERVQLARNGRLSLRNLRIPESDPLWTHFQYKSPATATLANNSTSSADPPRSSTAPIDDKTRPSTTEPPKRGVSSRELKEKKKKIPRADPRAEIQMKDESQRALKRSPADTVSEGRRTTVDASRDSRTQPPSASRQTKPTIRQEVEKLPSTLPKASTSHSEKPKPQEIKKLRESDVQGSDSEKARVKVKDRPPRKEFQEDVSFDSKLKLGKKKVAEEATEDRPIRKSLDEDHPNSRGSLKRKARDDPESVNPKNQKRRAVEEEGYTNARKHSKPKTRDDDEYTSLKPKTSSKRKVEQVDDDDYEPVRQKKLRPDRDSMSSTLSTSRDERQRKEYVATKKPGTEARTEDGIIARTEKVTQSSSTSKIRNISPPPPNKSNLTPNGRETELRRSLTLSGTNSNKPTKPRRKSPIYTSTEDEKDEEFTQPSDIPITNKVTTISKAQNRSPQALPSDDNLRARYNTTYLEHLMVMQKLLVQKGRLESLLKNGDLDNSGIISDSEGDVELLPPEELEVLSANHKGLAIELQAIQEAFNRRIMGEASSD